MPCLGSRRRNAEDLEALLPQYGEATDRQQDAHRRMHLYQMVRALGRGFMPTNDQAIIFLRAFIASEFLRASTPGLTPEGRHLLQLLNRLLHQVLDLLRHKNADNQLQTLIWSASQIRLVEDARRIRQKSSQHKRSMNATAAYESVRTIGSLLMTNADFRLFCNGLATIGQHITADTAKAASHVIAQTGDTLQPEADAAQQLQSGHEVEVAKEVQQAASVAGEGLKQVQMEAWQSLQRNASEPARDSLVHRLKDAVATLRHRPDYSDSIDTITLLFKRWARIYSRAVAETLDDVAVEKDENVDMVMTMAWSLLTSFGDQMQWKALEDSVRKVLKHADRDPQFEETVNAAADKAQRLLTDPAFYDADPGDLWPDSSSEEGSLQSDLQAAILQLQKTALGIVQDEDIRALRLQLDKIGSFLLGSGTNLRENLWADLVHVVVPHLIQSVHCIPIPRVEVSTPGLDLLLENLILEPGRTINASSFLPFSFKVQTYNDYELRKAHTREVTSSLTSYLTITVQGLSLAARDIGYWCRARSGFLSFVDQGLAGFELDERGIDISLDVEVGRERLEEILTLRKVRVKVHRLTYNLNASRFSCLAWVLKPLFRPVLRIVLERQLASAIADLFHAANRELIFARERLRATRISDPQDVRTFLRAIVARLTPAADPDLYTMVGVRPSKGIFRGIYAPGSIVKVWEEEGRLAAQKVEDGKLDPNGWQNTIFDIATIGLPA